MRVERRPGPYGPTISDTVTVSSPGRWVFVSGHIGVDTSDHPGPEDFAKEAAVCFERIQSSLESAGATMADVVKITAYLTDIEGQFPQYSVARGRAFPQAPPASATVQVSALSAGAKLEVEALAFVADGQ